jgi:hypothetical protein
MTGFGINNSEHSDYNITDVHTDPYMYMCDNLPSPSRTTP